MHFQDETLQSQIAKPRRFAIFGLLVGAACSRTSDKPRAASTPTRDATPADAAARAAPRAVQLALGYKHSCALFSDGTVRCWGLGADGRLGIGNPRTLGDDELPSSVGPIDLGGKAIAVAAGRAHTCALLDTKQVRCWGLGKQGQLGHGNPDSIGDDETPASAGDVSMDNYATAISASGAVACVVLGPAPESVRCWGDNSDGKLGYGRFKDGNLGDDESIATVMPIEFPRKIKQLAYPCALFVDGSVTCWEPIPGNRRDASTLAEDRPIKNLGGPVERLELFGTILGDGCVVMATGRARCWNGSRSLDHASETVAVPGSDRERDLLELPFSSVVDVAVTASHGCVLLQGGEVRCWGDRQSGMLGTPSGDRVLSKDAVVVDIGRPAIALAVGTARTCVITDQGAVRCWGYGKDGLLGYGTTENIGEQRSPSAAGDVPLLP